MRIFLIIAGTTFIGIGIVGIFLPILPTMPFLLLAAGCYVRSSTKLYNWLLNNRYFGNYIRNYREGKGIPRRVKILYILLLVLTIGYTSVFVIQNWWVRIILFLVLAGVSMHVFSFRTLKRIFTPLFLYNSLLVEGLGVFSYLICSH